MDFSHNHLTSSCISTILKIIQAFIIEKLIVSHNAINKNPLTDAICHLAHNEGDKIFNLNSGIPLVIINNAHTLQCRNSLASFGQCVTIILFVMNCGIDKSINNLVQEYHNQIKKIYFVNSIVATSDLKTTLPELCNLLPDVTEVVVYASNLKEEALQKAAAYLREVKLNVNYILASKTKLLAKKSCYHQVACLLKANSSINTVELINFNLHYLILMSFGKP